MAKQASRQVYVIFTAEIVPRTVEPLIQALSQLAQKGVSHVYIAFSTPGGDVAAGISLYNFLKSTPFHLTIHNIGNVDSIGNAIFLSAEKRVACENATFMFHGVGVNMKGEGRYEEKKVREVLDRILSDQMRIGRIITSCTSVSEEEVQGFFREAQTLLAKDAHERGIIHEIAEFHLPPNVPVISLVFQR